MNYYDFKNSAESTEIGWFPQSEIRKGVNPRDKDSIWNVKFFEFPDFLPNLELEIVSRAKITDMVSSVAISHGFIVNDKLMSLIKTHNLPEHVFYPGKLHADGLIIDYHWFHFITTGFWDWVDKKNSKLYLRSIIPDQRDKIIEDVNLNKTNSEFLSMANKMPMLTQYYWDKIVFNPNFPKYDIFSTPAPSYHTLISQRLLDALKEAEITGYEVKEFCEVEYNKDL